MDLPLDNLPLEQLPVDNIPLNNVPKNGRKISDFSLSRPETNAQIESPIAPVQPVQPVRPEIHPVAGDVEEMVLNPATLEYENET